MNAKLRQILERAESWPPQDQEDLAEFAREIEARRTGVYHASDDELKAVDQALGQAARGEIASKDEIEAAFAKFRGV
ncbi:MAG TPA: hypothetical protein VKV32_18865 [Stellaceae bacterium]|nr:hypothetical protein [Stellaceae bacterium]